MSVLVRVRKYFKEDSFSPHSSSDEYISMEQSFVALRRMGKDQLHFLLPNNCVFSIQILQNQGSSNLDENNEKGDD